MRTSSADAIASPIPPHDNAEPHRRLMEKLSKMTNDEIARTFVLAGIYTEDGELTEPYAPSDGNRSSKRVRRAR